MAAPVAKSTPVISLLVTWTWVPNQLRQFPADDIIFSATKIHFLATTDFLPSFSQ
jgi:hypothetical protein